MSSHRPLDRAVDRVRPRRLLELGTYCGYSALRMARRMLPDAHLYTVEFNSANADIARRIFAHAGIDDRVTVVIGTLGDGGETLRKLREEHGFAHGSLDLIFIDHDKDAYLTDLLRIEAEGWLHPGSVVVADKREVSRRAGVPVLHEGPRGHALAHRRAPDACRISDAAQGSCP